MGVVNRTLVSEARSNQVARCIGAGSGSRCARPNACDRTIAGCRYDAEDGAGYAERERPASNGSDGGGEDFGCGHVRSSCLARFRCVAVYGPGGRNLPARCTTGPVACLYRSGDADAVARARAGPNILLSDVCPGGLRESNTRRWSRKPTPSRQRRSSSPRPDTRRRSRGCLMRRSAARRRWQSRSRNGACSASAWMTIRRDLSFDPAAGDDPATAARAFWERIGEYWWLGQDADRREFGVDRDAR